MSIMDKILENAKKHALALGNFMAYYSKVQSMQYVIFIFSILNLEEVCI